MEDLILPQTYILGNGEISMKIKQISIDNVCGIKHLDITFNDGLNLICGENGVGKTTILKSISYYFIDGNKSYIKKHYGDEKGSVDLCFTENKNYHYEITDFTPGNTQRYTSDLKFSNHLLYFPTSRTIKYEKINSIPIMQNINSDIDSNSHSTNLLLLGAGNDIKKWYVNVYVFSKVGSLNAHQQKHLELCNKIFSLLDESISIETVVPNCEILLKQKNNKIYFEMLSDGYKSCIIITFGVIKEIEYRFPHMDANDFDGTIMIDEIDLHLHPQWQKKLVKILKYIFPNAQIIATTHSPSILQTAKSEEIIPLYKDENGDIHVKELHLGEYGLQGWTLEEIMRDVMGMKSTTSDLYMKVIRNFNESMNDENQEEILKHYKILKQMLHPQNPMLQLLEIQVAEWKN